MLPINEELRESRLGVLPVLLSRKNSKEGRWVTTKVDNSARIKEKENYSTRNARKWKIGGRTKTGNT